MNKVKNGPLMITVGTITFFFVGAMYVWSVIRIELTKVFPVYTAAQLSLCFTLMMSMFCIGGFVGGKVVQHKTPALSLRIGAALIFVGYLGASLMGKLPAQQALIVLYVFYSVLAGLGLGMGYNALMGNISPWFPQKIGLVAGVMMMGMGMSSLIFAFIIEWICPYIGIFKTILFLGIAISLMLFASSFVVKKPPVAAKKDDGSADGIESKTPKEMISSVSFWVYFLWNIFSGCSGLLIINSAANIAAYFGLAASLGMIISLFNGCGRPVVGAIVDKLGQYKAMFILNSMLVAAAAMLIISDSTGLKILMFLGMILVGIVYGGGGTIAARVINDLYGPRHFGVNHSISNFAVIAASFVGPLISGVLQDRSGGGFTGTFWMLMIISLVMLALIGALVMSVKFEKKNKKV